MHGACACAPQVCSGRERGASERASERPGSLFPSAGQRPEEADGGGGHRSGTHSTQYRYRSVGYSTAHYRQAGHDRTFPSGSSLRKRMASAEWYVQTGSSQPGSSYLQCR
jgi:hypothetical protein